MCCKMCMVAESVGWQNLYGDKMCLVVGWLRLVGSFKMHVFFAEYCLFYRAFLQKRPIPEYSSSEVLVEYV